MEKKSVIKKSKKENMVYTPYYDKSGDQVEGMIDKNKLKIVKGKEFPVEK